MYHIMYKVETNISYFFFVGSMWNCSLQIPNTILFL